MKRDMELIKEILIWLEETSDGRVYYPIDRTRFHCDDRTLDEHCRLIADKKLTKFAESRDGLKFLALTWDGYDFLDNARNSEVWNASVESAGKLSFGVFQKVLESAAIRYALGKLGL